MARKIREENSRLLEGSKIKPSVGVTKKLLQKQKQLLKTETGKTVRKKSEENDKGERKERRPRKEKHERNEKGKKYTTNQMLKPYNHIISLAKKT